MSFYSHPNECLDCEGFGWKCTTCGGTGKIKSEASEAHHGGCRCPECDPDFNDPRNDRPEYQRE